MDHEMKRIVGKFLIESKSLSILLDKPGVTITEVRPAVKAVLRIVARILLRLIPWSKQSTPTSIDFGPEPRTEKELKAYQNRSMEIVARAKLDAGFGKIKSAADDFVQKQLGVNIDTHDGKQLRDEFLLFCVAKFNPSLKLPRPRRGLLDFAIRRALAKVVALVFQVMNPDDPDAGRNLLSELMPVHPDNQVTY